EHPDIAPAIRRTGIRTTVGIPLSREGTPIGSITAFRTEVRPFSETHSALLQTFPAQAAIAVEDVRLVGGLRSATAEHTGAAADLTRSVGGLRARGEGGRVIAPPLDLETVLASVVSRANEPADPGGGEIYEFNAATRARRVQATDRFPEEFAAVLRTTPLVYG